MRVHVVLTTTPDLKAAHKLARLLIQKKLAACVSVRAGWESVYRWKGKIQTASEVLVLAKTSPIQRKSLQKEILRQHPYRVPELLSFSASSGSAGYDRWLQEVLR